MPAPSQLDLSSRLARVLQQIRGARDRGDTEALARLDADADRLIELLDQLYPVDDDLRNAPLPAAA